MFINAQVVAPSTDRTFTQIDLFPTILEALGIHIKGHKLGLGTSVFSNEKTLSEKYTTQELEHELSKKSRLYNSLVYGY